MCVYVSTNLKSRCTFVQMFKKQQCIAKALKFSVGTLCKLNVINWMIKFAIKWHIYSNNYL